MVDQIKIQADEIRAAMRNLQNDSASSRTTISNARQHLSSQKGEDIDREARDSVFDLILGPGQARRGNDYRQAIFQTQLFQAKMEPFKKLVDWDEHEFDIKTAALSLNDRKRAYALRQQILDQDFRSFGLVADVLEKGVDQDNANAQDMKTSVVNLGRKFRGDKRKYRCDEICRYDVLQLYNWYDKQAVSDNELAKHLAVLTNTGENWLRVVVQLSEYISPAPD